MHEIALDEAGNTGADLLNSDQPVFVLASVSLSREKADTILESIRTGQARELKFARLKKSASGRRRIIRFLASPELNTSNVITTFIHKKFMIVTKIVDLLVESLAHEDGLDLYKDGATIAFSNLHFHCMPTFCGEAWTETFLLRFVEMIRQRTSKSVQRFYSTARTLYEISPTKSYADALLPVLASERIIDYIIANSNKNSLDPAIPAFIQHCVFWGERLGESFDLVHDESKPIFQERTTLEDLMSRGEEEHEVGYDRRKFVFPLRARGIQLGRSEDDPRLQVADLVASASAQWASGLILSPSNQEFLDEIGETGVDRFLLGGVWPTNDISPKDLGTEYTGGINAIDHIAEFLSVHRKKA